MRRGWFSLFFTLSAAVWAQVPQISLGTQTRQTDWTTAIPIQISSSGNPPAAIQFDVSYDNTTASLAATAGSSATSASKTLYTHALQPNATRMILVDVNQNNIPDGISALRERYPEARFIEVRDLRMYAGASGSREHHDELRARGMAEARGSIIALIEDHGVAAEDWAAQMVESHRGGGAAMGGAIESGIDRPLNWAVYFCDFLRYQLPLPNGDSPIASDANVSY